MISPMCIWGHLIRRYSNRHLLHDWYSTPCTRGAMTECRIVLLHICRVSLPVPCDLYHSTQGTHEVHTDTLSNLVFVVADLTTLRTSEMQALAASSPSPPRYNRREGCQTWVRRQRAGPAHPARHDISVAAHAIARQMRPLVIEIGQWTHSHLQDVFSTGTQSTE